MRTFKVLADGLSTGFDDDKTVLQPFNEDTFIPLEVEKGTLVVLHGALMHMSFENRSDASRHAYTVHFVEKERPDGSYRWNEDNWLQRPDDAFPFVPL